MRSKIDRLVRRSRAVVVIDYLLPGISSMATHQRGSVARQPLRVGKPQWLQRFAERNWNIGAAYADHRRIKPIEGVLGDGCGDLPGDAVLPVATVHHDRTRGLLHRCRSEERRVG